MITKTLCLGCIDWSAVGAIASAVTAAIALIAIWYSLVTVSRQLLYQSHLQAKQLEQQLLLRVMELANLPGNSANDFIADLLTWRIAGPSAQDPERVALGARTVLAAHRQFSTATSAALSVLRRSRRKRFPHGTYDLALERYEDLVQRVMAVNARLLEYCCGDWTKLDLVGFQKSVGSDAVQIADLLRRVTAEILARMYADEPEWRALKFKEVAHDDTSGRVAFDFDDDNQAK